MAKKLDSKVTAVIPLNLLEQILYNESSCVDSNDVPALLLTIAEQAAPHNTEPAAAEWLEKFKEELREQDSDEDEDDDDEEEQE